MTTSAARKCRSVCDTVVSLNPVAAARSETLIGPAALMQVSRLSRVGSPSMAKVFARAWSGSAVAERGDRLTDALAVDDPVAGPLGGKQVHACQVFTENQVNS